MTSPPSRRPPSSGSRRIDKLLICLAFLLGAAHAEPAPVEVRVEDGVVDWSTREIRVLGVGTPTILSHTGSVTPQDPYLLARADAEERLRRVLVALPVDGRRAMDVEALAPLFETALQHWRADAPLYFSDGTLHLQGRASFAWGAALAGPPVPQAADAPTGLVIRLKQPMEPRLRLVLTGEAAPATPAGLPGDRKRLRQYLVQRFPTGQSLLEFGSLGGQLLIAECLDLIGEGIYLLDYLAHAPQLPVIAGAEQFFKAIAYHRISLYLT